MSEITKISWADSTINFWEGCTKVSAGCTHCYAEARDKRFTGGKLWGKGAPRRKSKSAVKAAFAMNRKPWICDGCGTPMGDKHPACAGHGISRHRRRIFSLSLGDWLDPEVPIEWLAEMLDTIRQCDQVTWILCTKRPELFFQRLEVIWKSHVCESNHQAFNDWIRAWGMNGKPPANVIMLTSVENQEAADERIPHLLRIPAAVRGLSLEPLLGPVDLAYTCFNGADSLGAMPGIHWLVIGGESGPNSRPCNVEWIRSLVKQGKDAGVAVHVKQLGAKAVMRESGCFVSEFSVAVAESIASQPIVSCELNDPKGGDPAEWPADLRVRQFPTPDATTPVQQVAK